MSSTRLFRPVVQSIVRSSPASRPAAAAAFSTKRNVAPFTPSVSSQIQEYGEIRKDAKASAATQDKKLGNGSVRVAMR